MSDVPTLYIDQQITRRKRWHIIHDARGEYETGSQWLGDCLDYLAKHGHVVYRIVDGPTSYEVTMHRVLDTKGP